jgi:hypothetical protein
LRKMGSTVSRSVLLGVAWVGTLAVSWLPGIIWREVFGGDALSKWLTDRKGRTLSYDDVTYYGKIVMALKETFRLPAEIDELIPSWPIE